MEKLFQTRKYAPIMKKKSVKALSAKEVFWGKKKI
jgi:hypothetical protein